MTELPEFGSVSVKECKGIRVKTPEAVQGDLAVLTLPPVFCKC